MHEKYLKILKCPKTNSSLFLKIYEKDDKGLIESGVLVTSDGKNKYPIINYIPRFVEQALYSSNFGFEWKKWQRTQFAEENRSKAMEGVTEKMFEEITDLKSKDLNGKIVLDYGCGSGRFLDLVFRDSSMAVGLDMSLAVDVARENFKGTENVLIVQGDAMNPPFKKGIFDVAYSIGVLHHTPIPEKSFSRMSKLVKSGGLVACCVYPNDSFYSFFSVKVYRKLFCSISKINRKFSWYIALVYAFLSANVIFYIRQLISGIPVFGGYINYIFERYLFVVVNTNDHNWRFLDTFDAITPEYASTHSSQEVKSWFVNNSFVRIKMTDWCKTSFVGIKK